MHFKWNALILRFIKFKYLPWTDMLLSPTFEMSKFLVTQVNMNDNLKLLQKVTTYKQPLYKKKKKSNHTETIFYIKCNFSSVC